MAFSFKNHKKTILTFATAISLLTLSSLFLLPSILTSSILISAIIGVGIITPILFIPYIYKQCKNIANKILGEEDKNLPKIFLSSSLFLGFSLLTICPIAIAFIASPFLVTVTGASLATVFEFTAIASISAFAYASFKTISEIVSNYCMNPSIKPETRIDPDNIQASKGPDQTPIVPAINIEHSYN